MTSTTSTTTIDSPIGPLQLTAEEGVLTHLFMDAQRHAPAVSSAWREDRAGLARVIDQLDAYFAGELTDFDVPVRPAGTGFQRAVWAALETVPYGETRSYGAIAAQVGRPSASRAVGQANGRNPIAIVIPCHRVIGSGGSLTGYGGGLDRKQWLLAHERGVLNSWGKGPAEQLFA
jgi:methylated-DNA-[protein]-cysteine S-methyltransferase